MTRIADLLLLVADQDMEFALRGLLSRPESLAIRKIIFKIARHNERDPGCRTTAAEFLRPFIRQYDHALVLFDREGSGGEERTASDLEDALREELAGNGWDERADVVVIDPELEVWLFNESPELDRILRWKDSAIGMREWLRAEGHLAEGAVKPSRPKEALKALGRRTGKRPSASTFEAVAKNVSLRDCRDRSFLRLRGILQEWFAPMPSELNRADSEKRDIAGVI